MRLLGVDEARERMLAGAAVLGVETVPLSQALGRILARPVTATRDQPPFPASAMDGWAVRGGEGAGWRGILGESAAGRGYDGVIGPGETVRIFTGAAVPDGADAIVIQEDARREGERVLTPAVAPGLYVRPAGLDFRAGDRLLDPPTALDPWRLALAAAAGWAELSVFARPVVAILATGEEIVRPGGQVGPFQIFDSGSTALAALCETWGAQARILSQVGDDEAAIAAAVAEAGGNLVVTLGGASVGDHDLVKPALTRLGLTLSVGSIAVRPGKPTWFGTLADGRAVLGLPGNPASALVCAEVFLHPLLRALQGAEPGPRLRAARARTPLAANGEREHWMRARLDEDGDGQLWVRPLENQDSSMVTVFADAGALLRRPPRAPAAEPGDVVTILALNRR